AADGLQQAIPVPIAGARGVDEAVVVEPAALALVEAAGRRRAERAAVARPYGGLAAGGLARERNAAEVDHGVLHGHLDVLAAARALALVQGGQDADGAVKAGARVADGRAGLERLGLRGAGQAERAADRLGDHVEAHVVLVRPLAEALDLRVDDPRVDLLDDVVAEAQPLDGAGREVLDHDVGLLEQLREDLAAARRAEVQGDATLVGVEQHEVVRVHALRVGGRAAPLVAALGILHLDDIGA